MSTDWEDKAFEKALADITGPNGKVTLLNNIKTRQLVNRITGSLDLLGIEYEANAGKSSMFITVKRKVTPWNKT